MRRPWLVVAALALLEGCATSARVADQITVSPEDYHSYRSFRAADTLEDKLRAAWGYVKVHPSGRYRDEVGGWFLVAEREYRTLARDRPELLQQYLVLLPDAPNTRLVRERIAELALARTLKSRREVELTVQAREFEQQLSDAERRRDTFLRALSDWIERLSKLRPWGVPVSELGQEFLVVYTLQEPAARCEATLCKKQLSYPYVIPERGQLAPRSGDFDVTLTLANGAVVGAAVGGLGLFDRVAEASQLTPVTPNDALARAEAIGRAVQFTGQALDERFPIATCGRQPISPVVLERECDGLRVRIIAADVPEQADRVEFTLVSQTPTPPVP